ncbi:hypothetical protein F3087_04770 [Nocardia colli]|uniref:Uncharacterized protein n=1 Tax=Nocardia colli TaxID=2545717 RepID=A0A5N0ER18_9NOCA|nr:hypothetical protein F3087_04770 [Nocardia colli]
MVRTPGRETPMRSNGYVLMGKP